MMKKLLLIIDVQEAFINKKTEKVVTKIESLINNHNFSKIVLTKFINNDKSILAQKGNYFGCIGEDRKLVIDPNNNQIIEKNLYSAVNTELKKILKADNYEIYLCGIDTECCILKTALDLFEMGYNVYVLKDYCACMHGKIRHNNALTILKRTIGSDAII